MNQIKYTFVVPVYNTSKVLLDRCIKSIENQYTQLKNYEIIIVDDGSTKQETIDYLTSINIENCTIYFNESHGVSYTRNYGMNKANSNNIIFIDSDDYISEYFIDKLEKIEIDNYDLIYFKNYIQKENSKRKYKARKYNLGVVWAKVFKKDIIIKNGIFFNTKLKFCEDSIFLNEYLKQTNKIYECNSYEYVYVVNNKSVGHKFDTKNYIYFNDSISALRPYLSTKELNIIILLFFVNYVLPTSIFNKDSKYSKKEKIREAINVLENNELLYEKILYFNLKQFNLLHKIYIFLIRKHKFEILLLFNKLVNFIKYVIRRT